MSNTTAHDVLARVPAIALAPGSTSLEPLPRLAEALGLRARLLVKRDDAISFGFGGNKVRKMEFVLRAALDAGAETLITCGGVQSNHARVTAAAAARHGLSCVIVANGQPPERLTANALLDALLGAEVRYVDDRDARAPAMAAIAAGLEAEGRRPFVVPLGASTPVGALGYVRAVEELAAQCDRGQPWPDVIVHATSSGGTQAGLVAGCRLFGREARVIGISADDPAPALQARIAELLGGIETVLALPAATLDGPPAEVDDSFLGEGYGVATAASREAQALAARTEALFVDHTYTAKALAGLIAYAREGRFEDARTVLFWHTGGQVGLFA